MCAIERNVRTNRGKGEDGPPIYLEPVNSKHNLKISSLQVRGSGEFQMEKSYTTGQGITTDGHHPTCMLVKV